MSKRKYKDIIERMRLEDKVAFCSGADNWRTKPLEEYGIPSIWMADGPHGLRKQPDGSDEPGVGKSIPSTCFPTACALACSWDRDLLFEVGEAIGEEALQEKVSIVLGPGVNIKRNPLCGRNFEYYSEDPFLSGMLAQHWIKGVQSKDVDVCIKHFTANNQENLRMQSDSIIDERTLREIYLTAFEIAIKGVQPKTIMCAYNLLNGTHCSDHTRLLRKILRDEWGFDGIVITDWGAMNDRVQAFKAGLDLEMPGGVSFFDQSVLEAVWNGELSEEYIDACVERLLGIVFDGHAKLVEDFAYDVKAHHRLARKVAAQSAVLLKNEDNILPLDKATRIAVIGSLAKHPRYQGAGSSFINPTILENVLDGFEKYSVDHTYFPGYELSGEYKEELIAEAVAGAKISDVALVFVGLTEELESEGFDKQDMNIPQVHNDLVEAVTAINPNTIVIIAGGASIIMPWLSKVKAVLHMYLAGQAGGLAVADLLLGEANPCGKLAETYPLVYDNVPSADIYEDGGKQAQYQEGLYVGYRYFDTAKVDVAFPFGYGLSYTEFEYSDLSLSKKSIKAGEELIIKATVRNSGKVAGAEIVQVYIKDLSKHVYRPDTELKDFAKIFLEPGEKKQVAFKLNKRSFAIYDPRGQDWIVPNGEYAVCIAASSRDIRLQESVRVQGVKVKQEKDAIPEWYAAPRGKPSQSDFEKLLGRKIETKKDIQKGDYTLDCSLMEMNDSFIIRQVIRYVEKSVADRYGGADYSNPNFLMAVNMAVGIPLRSLVLLSEGDMPANIAQGLVHIANGQPLRGLRSILGK